MADRVKGEAAVKILRREDIVKGFADSNKPIDIQVVDNLGFMLTNIDVFRIRRADREDGPTTSGNMLRVCLIKQYSDQPGVFTLQQFIDGLTNIQNENLKNLLLSACQGAPAPPPADGTNSHHEPTKPPEPGYITEKTQKQFEKFATPTPACGPEFNLFMKMLKSNGILDYGKWVREYKKDKEYNVFTKPKGRLLIINNKRFANLEDLCGYESDAKLLKKWFKMCDFETKVEDNLNSDQILKVVKEFSKDENHVDSKSAFVVILSHGMQDQKNNDMIAGVDATVTKVKDDQGNVDVQPNTGFVKLEDLITPVSKCTTLEDKPKVFVVQACRGNLFNVGLVKVNFDDKQPAQPAGPGGELHPQGGDVLRAFATIPGHVSWVADGSWFIQALLAVFSDYAAEEDVLSMLTMVSELVAKKTAFEIKDKQGNLIGAQMQQTSTDTRLHKKLFLNPGLFEPPSQ